MSTQPVRAPDDGPIQVNRPREGRITISVSNAGEEPKSIEMSEFNAWRVFGGLAMMLGIQLPPKLAKQITMV